MAILKSYPNEVESFLKAINAYVDPSKEAKYGVNDLRILEVRIINDALCDIFMSQWNDRIYFWDYNIYEIEREIGINVGKPLCVVLGITKYCEEKEDVYRSTNYHAFREWVKAHGYENVWSEERLAFRNTQVTLGVTKL